MTELICLRHAEAESNVARTLAPSLESRLTERGRNHAAAAARNLRHASAVRVCCSPARRAIETATIIAAASGLEVEVLDGLREVGIGPLADPLDEANRPVAVETLRAWIVDEDLERNYVGGETGTEVVRRTADALGEIVGANLGQTVVVVGHVASLSVALSSLCGLGSKVWGRPLPHAEPFHVTFDAHGTWLCEDWPL